MDNYLHLDVNPDASQEEIQAAYQRQRERYALDNLTELDSELQAVAHRRLAELEQAYAVLSDPEQRRLYDAQLNGARQVSSTQLHQAAPRKTGISHRELWYTFGGVAVAIALIAGLWLMTDSDALPSVGEVNRPAPDFELATLDGGQIALADYRGKVVMVNFWGTWCEPCKRETPALQAAYSQLQDDGLVIVGVNLTDDERVQGNTEADIRAFVEQYDVTYPIALDEEGDVLQAFRVYPLPTSFFIDPDGTIRYVRVGEITTDEVIVLFESLKSETTARRSS